jgi:hypothetical protein
MNRRSRALTALTAAWVSLASGSALASPAAAHHDGITLFNWPTKEDGRIGLAYLIINFVVLAFLIHRLILRKLISDNQVRHDDIKRQVDEAATALREAQSVITDYKNRVSRIDAESQQILDEARQAADRRSPAPAIRGRARGRAVQDLGDGRRPARGRRPQAPSSSARSSSAPSSAPPKCSAPAVTTPTRAAWSTTTRSIWRPARPAP